MKCPVCGTPDLLMTERQGVEIDYCPTCRGVWLDRGELDKLIERTDGGPAMTSPAQSARSYERMLRPERDVRERDDDVRFGHHRESYDRRDVHQGYDDRRRHHDQPRKKKSLFEMFDFD